MAGYIFTLGKSEDVLENYFSFAKNGVFGTIFNPPKINSWSAAYEATFGDYLSMKEGDHVYFFFKRKIYGIGVLKSVTGSGDARYLNYPGADFPIPNPSAIKKPIINDDRIRVVFTFINDPYFFKNGIDMDLVLQSKPYSFRMLRAMWKVSFIKIDDEEDNALFEIILRENKTRLFDNEGIKTSLSIQKQVANLVQKKSYKLSSSNLVINTSDGEGIRHEMVIECDLIEKLSLKEDVDVFGEWDYISHQVVASPFKPIDYMDKIDIFGYQKIKNYNSISRYMCIEIKKDAASIDLINQIMKYVDWIKDEYANGDYEIIDAYVVAQNYSDEVIAYAKKIGVRNYIKGVRAEIENKTWGNLYLITYRFDSVLQKIVYKKI